MASDKREQMTLEVGQHYRYTGYWNSSWVFRVDREYPLNDDRTMYEVTYKMAGKPFRKSFVFPGDDFTLISEAEFTWFMLL